MDKVTMSVQEMAMQMGISLSKAYALTREEGFPIVQDVRKASRRTEKRWMVLFVEIRRKKWTYNESSISN